MTSPFTSVCYPLAIDSGLGRLEEEPDYARHVEQMIRQLLLTNPGERINMPDFGCGVRRMLFAPNSSVSATLAQLTVYESLNRWMSSVLTVNEVKAEAVNEKLLIRIVYTLRARQEKRYLNLEVTL